MAALRKTAPALSPNSRTRARDSFTGSRDPDACRRREHWPGIAESTPVDPWWARPLRGYAWDGAMHPAVVSIHLMAQCPRK